MPAVPYAGHSELSASQWAATKPDDVTPADRPDFDPKAAQWADQPGAAARDKGYPRD